MKERIKEHGASPEEFERLSPLLNSSLWSTVASLEIHYAFTANRRIRRVRAPRDRVSDLAAITGDPEYIALRDHILGATKDRFFPEKREAALSLDAYTDFLVSENTPSGSKLYAASPQFISEIKKHTDNHPPGPYFRRILHQLGKDEGSVAFVHANLGVFADWDEEYFWLKSQQESWEKEPEALQAIYGDQYEQCALNAQRASEYLAMVTTEVLDTVFNPQDKSKWRNFLMREFAVIALMTSLVGHSTENYNPLPQLTRIKKLAEVVDPADWSLLGIYLFYSSWSTCDEAREILDQEIATGDLTRAEVLTLFYTDHRGKSSGIREVLSVEEDLVKFWQKEYLDGRVSAEDFLKISVLIRKIRSAVLALPGSIPHDTLLLTNSINTPSGDKKTDGLLFTHEFLEDGELITTLVASGIPPQTGMRNRLRNDPQALEAVCDFGRSLFLLGKEYNSIFASVVDYWTKKYLDGEITLSELQQTGNLIESVSDACSKFVKDALGDHTAKVKKEVEDLLRSPSLMTEREELVWLLNSDIFPTPVLRQFVRGKGAKGIQALKELAEQTRQGTFDSTNLAQRDLEYRQFLELVGGNYEKFVSLPVWSEEYREGATIQERWETEAAAYEAALLYHFIRKRVEGGRKTTIVGNNKYGELFVVGPLTNELNQLGVSTRYERVSSSETSELSAESIFPRAFVKTIRKECPDIIIVDGTSHPIEDNAPRYPRSILGYLNWFLAYNEAAGVNSTGYLEHLDKLRKSQDFKELVVKLKRERVSGGYDIAFWLPYVPESDYVFIGSLKAHFRKPGNEGAQVIFANTVIAPNKVEQFSKNPVLRGHIPGFFDDPDTKANRSELFFGKNGVERIIFGKTEEEFIKAAADNIYYALPRMIQRSQLTGI